MNFGEMIERIKDGQHRAYRANWNGIKYPGRPRGYDKDKQLESIKNSNDIVYKTFSQINIENTEKMIEKDEKAFPQMFIYVVKGRVIPNSEVREPLKSWLDGKDMDITDHIDMKTTDGKIVSGWLASQTDMLSDDWEICWQDIKLKVTQDIIPGPVIRTKEEMDMYLKEQEDFRNRAEEALNNPKIAKIYSKVLEPNNLFTIQLEAVLHEKLKSQKVLWVDSDPKLVRAKIAVDLFGGDFKDSGSRYLDLFLKQDDLIIVFGKGLKKEIQEQITDMGLTNKRLLSIEVKIDDISTIKENIIKQLSEVYKDG